MDNERLLDDDQLALKVYMDGIILYQEGVLERVLNYIQ